MYHCHILEHEDAGMMGSMCVLDGFWRDQYSQSADSILAPGT